MRTGKVILSGTLFFCVLQTSRFLPTWGLVEMLVLGVYLPYFCSVNQRQ